MRFLPKTIITDQDVTIGNAIQQVIPNTFHRLCKWHFMHKMGDKIGKVYQDSSAMTRMYKILNYLQNVEELEKGWDD